MEEEKNISIENTGLVGQLIVIILFENKRKVAVRLIAENRDALMVENSVGMRSLIYKNMILKIRRPLVTHEKSNSVKISEEIT
jgi:hypothetical protein